MLCSMALYTNFRFPFVFSCEGEQGGRVPLFVGFQGLVLYSLGGGHGVDKFTTLGPVVFIALEIARCILYVVPF